MSRVLVRPEFGAGLLHWDGHHHFLLSPGGLGGHLFGDPAQRPHERKW